MASSALSSTGPKCGGLYVVDGKFFAAADHGFAEIERRQRIVEVHHLDRRVGIAPRNRCDRGGNAAGGSVDGGGIRVTEGERRELIGDITFLGNARQKI